MKTTQIHLNFISTFNYTLEIHLTSRIRSKLGRWGSSPKSSKKIGWSIIAGSPQKKKKKKACRTFGLIWQEAFCSKGAVLCLFQVQLKWRAPSLLLAALTDYRNHVNTEAALACTQVARTGPLLRAHRVSHACDDNRSCRRKLAEQVRRNEFSAFSSFFMTLGARRSLARRSHPLPGS